MYIFDAYFSPLSNLWNEARSEWPVGHLEGPKTLIILIEDNEWPNWIDDTVN